MKSRWHWFTAATLAVFGLTTAAMADGVAVQLDDQSSVSAAQVSWTSSEQRLSEVEAELASLKQQVAGDVYSDVGCDTCCDPCCRPCGIVAGAELTFLKPHMSGGMTGISNVTNVEYDYELAPRFWLGFTGTSGLGMQVRYWWFDDDAWSTPAGALGETPGFDREILSIDTYVFDVEATFASVIGCNWDVLFTGGFRYLDFQGDRTSTLGGNLVDGEHYGFHGYGGTVSGQVRRCFFGNFGLLGNVRGSAVMGDGGSSVAANGVWGPRLVLRDDLKFMAESQLGIDWMRELANGGALTARVVAELQYWDGFSGTGGYGPGSIGFGGWSLMAGIVR